MNDALVMGHKGQQPWFIRSDYVAARMMQRSLAQGGEGEQVKVLRDGDRAEMHEARAGMRAERMEHRAEMREARYEERAEMREGRSGAALELRETRDIARAETVAPVRALEAVRDVRSVEAPATPIVGEAKSESLHVLREKVAEMTRALESLTKAMDAMGDFKLLVAEGDSASVVAFAGQVLADMRNDAEAKFDGDETTAEMPDEAAESTESVEPVTADAPQASQGDTMNLTGDTITNIHGDAGDDVINAMAAMEARNIYGGAGSDVITVSAQTIDGVYGGGGADTITVTGEVANDIVGGDGNDIMNITAPFVEEVKDGAGDDDVTITARDVAGIIFGAGNDSFDLQVGRAKLQLAPGSGNDTVNIRDAAHIELLLGDHENMMGENMATIWKGDTLVIEFDSGDRIELNNAANAGSLTLRAGDDVINLKPQVPAVDPQQMLDVSV